MKSDIFDFVEKDDVPYAIEKFDGAIYKMVSRWHVKWKEVEDSDRCCRIRLNASRISESEAMLLADEFEADIAQMKNAHYTSEFNSLTVRETYDTMRKHPEDRDIFLMNFVNDFRYHRDMRAVQKPFETGFDDQEEAMLAGVVESLCDEVRIEPPEWTKTVPACKVPYFRHELERLQEITIKESPLRFRRRNVFVLANFLYGA